MNHDEKSRRDDWSVHSTQLGSSRFVSGYAFRHTVRRPKWIGFSCWGC